MYRAIEYSTYILPYFLQKLSFIDFPYKMKTPTPNFVSYVGK